MITGGGGRIFASGAHSLAHTREYFYESAATATDAAECALLERQNEMNRWAARDVRATNNNTHPAI